MGVMADNLALGNMVLVVFLSALKRRALSNLNVKAVGAGDPVSGPYEEAVFLQGLQYAYVMAPEVCIFQGVFLDQV